MHAYNKLNIKHNTDILLKMSKSHKKCIKAYDLLSLLLLLTTIILVIYNYIHETKHIPEVYAVTAIL